MGEIIVKEIVVKLSTLAMCMLFISSSAMAGRYSRGEYYPRPKPKPIKSVKTDWVDDSHHIKWNYNDKGFAIGTGCNSKEGSYREVDTWIIEAHNDLSIIFSGLNINLDDSYKRVARTTCKVRIPTLVRKGYYLADLHQTLTYGYTRTTSNSGGDIQLSTSFYNQRAGRFDIEIPHNDPDDYWDGYGVAEKTSSWLVSSRRCSKKNAYRGMFQANLTASGWRGDLEGSILIQLDGQDLRFEARGEPLLCP